MKPTLQENKICEKPASQEHWKGFIAIILMLIPLIAILSVYLWSVYQTDRLSKNILKAYEQQVRLLEEGKKAKVELAHLKSPKNLIPLAKKRGFVLPENIIEVHE